MRAITSSNKNEVNFTLKLAPSQLRYLASLKPVLGFNSEQSVLREVLIQFCSWFSLPVYQREVLKRELVEKKTNILQYVQELLARHFEELNEGKSASQKSAARKLPTKTEEQQPFAVRMPPALLAYADELKAPLGKGSTAEVIREIVSQLEDWFELPRYQAERLDQERQSRGLHIVEYVQETLARRYEALRDGSSSQRSGRR